MPSRYALYWTPPPGPLAEFGAAWLGWDPARGAARARHPALPGLPRPVAALTQGPRRYGLHATLWPPMRLRPGLGYEDAEAEARRLAARLAPARAEGLRLARMEGGFVALVPEGSTAAIDALAAACVRAMDPLRAPLDAAQVARRRQVGLDAPGEALLARWGYPHVMEAFRFHVTLTGALPEAEARAVEAALARPLAPLLPRPFALEAISVMEEGADGFRLRARVPLGR